MKCGDIMKKILTVLLFALVLSGCSNSGAFIRIGSYSASEEEYKIYLDETIKTFEKVGGNDIWETDFNGKSAEEVAKDSALNSLVAVKIVCSKADQYDVKVSDEMRKKAEEDAKDYIADNGKHDTIVKEVMLEKQIYEKVKAAVLSDYMISENDYKNFCDLNREKYTDEETEIKVNEAYFAEKNEADNFVLKLKNGTDFETAVSQLGITNTDETSMNKTNFKQEFNTDDISEHACGITKDDKGYAVYSVKSVSKPDENVITEKMRDDYKTQTENSLFEQKVDNWKADFKITKDEEKWKNISV